MLIYILINMKILNLFFLTPFINKNKSKLFLNIKNIDKPICSNCKFYKPTGYSNYDSDTSKCLKFGERDIYTGEINYDYVSSCRNTEDKCGLEGKFYDDEPNIYVKKFKYHFFERYGFIYSTLFIYFIIFFFQLKINKIL